jgi:hypothetical protein
MFAAFSEAVGAVKGEASAESAASLDSPYSLAVHRFMRGVGGLERPIDPFQGRLKILVFPY